MKKSDFYYDLPPELIAQQPLPERPASRLLVVDKKSGRLHDSVFSRLIDFLQPGDLLVFNDTRVIPARLFGHKATGGKLEVLVERVLSPRMAKVMVKASKSPRLGAELFFGPADAPQMGRLTARKGMFWLFEWSGDESLLDFLQQHGHMPLPPYIQRQVSAEDSQRYQTVYSRQDGAVAAPTAGLHFDKALLQQLADKGIRRAFVTLHVGAGTFQPVRADDIRQHRMHKEWLSVPEAACQAINRARAAGKRVVAVGTTSVRSLETAAGFSANLARDGLQPYTGDTDIFIYPGYRFQVVDAMITNFHLPESTLLMLVSAFAGKELIDKAYHHAIAQRYRFFSYGDAMLLV